MIRPNDRGRVDQHPPDGGGPPSPAPPRRSADGQHCLIYDPTALVGHPFAMLIKTKANCEAKKLRSKLVYLAC